MVKSPSAPSWLTSFTGEYPFKNAFANRLSDLGFEIYDVFSPDLMHDFETGVWKSLLIHLVRLLEAYDAKLLREVDRRYLSRIDFEKSGG